MDFKLSDCYHRTEGTLVPPFAVRIALISIERISFLVQAHDLGSYVKMLGISFSGSSKRIELTVRVLPGSPRAGTRKLWKKTYSFTAEEEKAAEPIVEDVLAHIREL